MITLQESKDSVFSLAFSPDSKYLASGDYSNTVTLWSVKPQKQIVKLKGHSQFVTSVLFSPDGKYIASCSGDKSIRLWSVDTKK